jgi:GNAT superfamily N-acetyltransferase
MTKPDIVKFLHGHLKNDWIGSIKFHVYVRKSVRFINGVRRTSFDIANINVATKYRGKGLFTKWLSEVEMEVSAFGIECIFVESILNARLITFLEKHGYSPVQGSYPPSMFKRLKGE